MNTRTLYLYDSTTKQYTGVIVQSESPVEPGVYFEINNTTDMPPPAIGVNSIALFNNGYWIATPDFRGQVWYDSTGNAVTIQSVGTPVGLTPTPLPSIILSNLQASLRTSFSANCSNVICSGFNSSALGVPYLYASSTTDQLNINSVATVGGSLWCQDSKGTWNFVAHTITQASQVQKDMVAYVQVQQAKYSALLVKIVEATSPDQLSILTW